MADKKSRRKFIIQVSTGAAAGAAAGCGFLPKLMAMSDKNPNVAQGSNTLSGEIPQRPLGQTGVQVSALGLGGSHLGSVKSESEAARIVHEAIAAGVTFMDNAWEYHQGRSEEWMGKALQGRRDKVFLMTKVCTHGRDRQTAMQQLEQSLRRLQTDYLDLWQVHEVIYDNDPELHFARNGVIEALDQAKREGKVRFVGFTGHKDPAIHLKMLTYGYDFDTCQLPLNCFDATFRSFEQQVLPELTQRGIAAIGMKSLGGKGDPVQKGIVPVTDALRYAMSLPVATTVSGIDSLEVLRQNLSIAGGFTPLTAEEMQAIRTQYTRYAADGRFELYKTSKQFDGAPGRQQHGFPLRKELSI
jgi:aryl-alcohol dehydrogenase-like predicted oxidoreductase